MTLWLSSCVTRGPGQMAEFKGTHKIVFPQAAFKLYMEVSIQLTPKPRSQPLASSLTSSSVADSGQSGKSVAVNVSVQHACQSALNRRGNKKSKFQQLD